VIYTCTAENSGIAAYVGYDSCFLNKLPYAKADYRLAESDNVKNRCIPAVKREFINTFPLSLFLSSRNIAVCGALKREWFSLFLLPLL